MKNKTFKQVEVNNRKYNFLDLPGTDYFKFEIVNLRGSEIEKYYNNRYNKNVFGITHFVEHLSFRNTLDYSSDELLSLLKSEGTYNASTDYERVNYWFKTISDNAELAIKLVCNIALNNLAKITEEEFQIEKKVVFNEAKRYADDDATKFWFDSSAVIRGYNIEDTVIGIPETIDTFTLEDSKRIKDILMQGEHIFNISYDSDTISQEEIINLIEEQLKRHSILNITDKVSNEVYNSFIKYPVEGNFIIESEAAQSMQLTLFDVVTNYVTASACNDYIANYAKDSLEDVIRERAGLTYSLSLYSSYLNDKDYTFFSTDVSEGDEELLFKLFGESLTSSIENWTTEEHERYLKVSNLKRKMNLIDLSNYEYWFTLAVWYPEITYRLKSIISKDLDNGYIALDNLYRTKEKMEIYIKRLLKVFKENNYTRAFNKQ